MTAIAHQRSLRRKPSHKLPAPAEFAGAAPRFQFTIEDIPLEEAFSKLKTPSVISRAIALLEALPPGTLLKTAGLHARLNVGRQFFYQHMSSPLLRDFRQRCCGSGRPVLWGSQSTILEFRRRLDHENET